MTFSVFLFVLAQAGSVPAPPSPQAAEPAGVLADLVAALDARNPELAVARRQIDVQRARVAPAGAPADPVLSLGYMGGISRAPFFPAGSDPDGFRQVGISESLPWPGTLEARTRAAEAGIGVAAAGADVVRAGLVEKLKSAYVDYLLAVRTQAIVLRQKQTLDDIARSAEARLSVGKVTPQDVLQAQTEITRALERLTMLDADRRRAQIEINRLTARPSDTTIPVADLVVTPDAGLADIATHMEGHVPAHVAHHDAAVTFAEKAVDAARAARKPALSVDLFVRRPGGGLSWMTGADVMVTLPIFRSRREDALLKEARASVEVARSDRDRILTEVDATTAMARVQIDESRRLLALYADSLLPQAKLTSDAALTAYESGNVDVLTVLRSAMAAFDIEVAQEEQQRQLRRALISLEPLVGRELVR